MVELLRQGEIIDAMDALWGQLLAGAPQAQRTLSFNLYQAALAVAVHGCEEVSSQLAARAATWRAASLKRSTDETKSASSRITILRQRPLFSASSSLSRRASETVIPAYFAFQL